MKQTDHGTGNQEAEREKTPTAIRVAQITAVATVMAAVIGLLSQIIPHLLNKRNDQGSKHRPDKTTVQPSRPVDRPVPLPKTKQDFRQFKAGLAAKQGEAINMIIQGRFEEAKKLTNANRKVIQEALRMFPDDAMFHDLLGYSMKDLYLMGRENNAPAYLLEVYLKAARQAFEKALMIDPNDPSAHNGIGNVLLLDGKLCEAKEAIEKALVLADHKYYAASHDLRLVEAAIRNDPEARKRCLDDPGGPKTPEISDEKRAKVLVSLNSEGFLQDPSLWDEEVAAFLAKKNGIPKMTDEHWKVVHYIRNYYLEFNIAPMIRKLTKDSGFSLEKIYDLFPGGPKAACIVAGLPNAKGCI